MEAIRGNIWECNNDVIVIPTNGFIKKNGSAVMGRGLALQASKKYPKLSEDLGVLLKEDGDKVYYLPQGEQMLVTFPVKYNWWENADLALIRQSASQLSNMFTESYGSKVCLPKVGCGNGKLNWEDVEPILDVYLNRKPFLIVDIDK